MKRRKQTRSRKRDNKLRHKTFVPQLETLEDRRLLATFNQVGTTLNLDLDKANTNLSIVARPAASTQLYDVTSPGDTADPFGTSPSREGADKAIDNSLARFNVSYHEPENRGFTVTVKPERRLSVVTGLRITTANDAVERDPTSYRLLGSDSASSSFTLISEGTLTLPDARNTAGPVVTFSNNTPYQAYRLLFPAVKNGAVANSAQVAEVELLGREGSGDVTKAGDRIEGVDDNNNDSPRFEGAQAAIDGLADKYLNFGKEHSGLIVEPSIGSTVVTGLNLFTAGDAPERDPAGYKLEGANSFNGPFAVISEADVNLPDARNRLTSVTFSNSTPYKVYRLTFPKLKDSAAANAMQIGEIELIGTKPQASGSIALTLNNGDTWKGQDSEHVKGMGTSTLTVSDPTGNTFSGGIKISDSVAGTGVTFADSGTFQYRNSIDVKLDHPSAGPVIFEGATAFAGNAKLTAASSINVALHSGSVVSTEDGDLTLLANQQLTPRRGNFHGIFVDGTVQSTGKGNVALKGRAGKDNSQHLMAGVKVTSKGRVVGGTAGTLQVEGQGGTGAFDPFNASNLVIGMIGVHVEGGTIDTKGANVNVVGNGGASVLGTLNDGVHLNSGGKITAGGNGNVRVSGTGGKDGSGVYLREANTTITSSGGNVSVTGKGGNNPNSSHQIGVRVQGGAITAGGSGTILVSGHGGTGNANSDGVRIESGGKITSSKETLTVIGTAGTPAASSVGIVAESTISHSGNGSGIALIADTMTIASAGSVAAGSNAVAIRPKTSNRGIDLGAATAADKLALSDAELDRITAAALQIGDLNQTGPINVSSNITRPAATYVTLLSAGAITANPSVDTNGGTLRVNQNGRLTAGETIQNSGLDFLSAGPITQTSGGFTTPHPVAVGIGSFKQLLFPSGLTVNNGTITTPGKVQAITKSGNVDLFLGVKAADAAQRIAIPISQLIGTSTDDEFKVPKGQAYDIKLNAKQTFVPTHLKLAAGSSDVGLRMAGALHFTDLGGEGAELISAVRNGKRVYPLISARPASGDVGENLSLDANAVNVYQTGAVHGSVDENGKFAPATIKLGGSTVQGSTRLWEWFNGQFQFAMTNRSGPSPKIVFDGGEIDVSEIKGTVSLSGEVKFTKADVRSVTVGRLVLGGKPNGSGGPTLPAEFQGNKILVRGLVVVAGNVDLGEIDFNTQGSELVIENGKAAAFSKPVTKVSGEGFTFTRNGFGTLMLNYDPATNSYRVTSSGGKVQLKRAGNLNHLFGKTAAGGNTIDTTEIALNVYLSEVTQSGTKFSADGITIANGRLDRFKVFVGQVSLPQTYPSVAPFTFSGATGDSEGQTKFGKETAVATFNRNDADKIFKIEGRGTVDLHHGDGISELNKLTVTHDIRLGGNHTPGLVLSARDSKLDGFGFSLDDFSHAGTTFKSKFIGRMNNDPRFASPFVEYAGSGTWQFRNQNIPVAISGTVNRVQHFFAQGAIDFDDSLSSLKVQAASTARKVTLRSAGWGVTRPLGPQRDVIEIEGSATVVMHGKAIPVQMFGFRVQGNGFATDFTRDRNFSPLFATKEPFVVEGIKLQDTRAIITIPRTGLNSTSEFQWRSGRLNYKINDVSTTAAAVLPMTVRGGQLFLSDQSQPTLEFGSVTIAGIQFADGALKASWQQSDRRWVFAGNGSYFGTPVTVGGDPKNPQIIQERGVFKLINFSPPPLENVQLNGVLFHLKQLAKRVVGDKVTYTGSQEIFVGGAKIKLSFGDDNTAGIVLNTQTGKVEEANAKVEGEFTVGNVPITGDLEFKYIAAKNQFIINGTASFTFQASTGPVNISVRLGTSGGDDGLVITNGKVESVTASISADFKLFGLEIDVEDLGLIYKPDERTYGVFGKLKVSSPPSGTTRVLDEVEVELGSGPSSPGLLIKDGELERLDVAISGTITLGSLQATPDQLRLTYTRAKNELALTGGVTVNIASKFTAKAAFPGSGLLINLKTGKVQVKGLELRVGDIKVGAFEVNDLGFVYEEDDQGNTTVTGGGMLTLPAGLEIEAEFTLKNNRLSAVTFGVTRVPGIPVGQPPVLFVTGLKGELTNLDDLENFQVKATITATIGPAVRMFGERHAIAELEGSILVNKDKLELEGNVKLVGGLLGRGQGKVQIFFRGTELLRVDASINLFPGDIMRGSLSFSVDRDANVTFRGDLGVFVPDGIPAVGGKSVGTLEVYMQVRPKLSASQSFARFKATVLELIEFGAKIDFTGYLSGYVNPPVFAREEFGFYLPGAREFVIPLNDETDSTLFVDNQVALPTMQIHSVTTADGSPSATVTYSGTSELPSDTLVDLYVDTEPGGYQGHLLTSVPFQPGQQNYNWHDFAAYAPVPYDPNRPLYVYGAIHDGNNFPVYTDYSAPLVPPNFNPTLKTPGEQKYDPNGSLIFSKMNDNGFEITDPMAAGVSDAQVSVSLNAGAGLLFVSPENAVPWQNTHKPTDANGDGNLTPLDVLLVIRHLRDPMLLDGDGRFPMTSAELASGSFYDVNGDGKATANDVLIQIRALNDGSEPGAQTPDSSNVEIVGDGTDEVTLIGTASQVNALLNGITYVPYENSFFDDQITVSVGRYPDFYFAETEATVDLKARALTIGADNGLLSATSYGQGSGPVAPLDDIAIHSMASGRLRGVTVSIGGYVEGKDTLELPIDDQLDLGIEAHFDAHSGKLMLTGLRSPETYEAALQLVTFNSNGTGNRTLTVSAGDDDHNTVQTSRRVSIKSINQPPVVRRGLGGIYMLSETRVDEEITVSDPEDGKLKQATVAIRQADYVQGEDVFKFTDQSGITGSFDAGTGVLTLTGEATATDYQTALRSVTYDNTRGSGLTEGVRTVTVSVDDGQSTNSVGSDVLRLYVTTGQMEIQSPTISISPNVLQAGDDRDPIVLAPELSLTGSDVVPTLLGAEVAITDNYMPGEDVLRVKGLPEGITSTFDPIGGVLLLSGEAPVSYYEFALQSVTYANHAAMRDGLSRTISFTADDGVTGAEPATVTVEVPAVPMVLAGMGALEYTQGRSSVALDAELVIDYMGGPNLTGAKVAFTWNYTQGEDQLSFAAQDGITGTFDPAAGVLTLSGTATVAQYQEALRSVQYTNTRVNPIPGLRLLDVTVQDGQKTSAEATVLVNVDTEFQPLMVTLDRSPLTFVEKSDPIMVAGSFTVQDQDAPRADGTGTRQLYGASVLVDGFVEGEDRLTFTPQGNIEGEFAPHLGELLLFGHASAADYQTVLRSVKYENVSEAPTTSERFVFVTLFEGAADVSPEPVSLNVQSLNNPPTRTAGSPFGLSLLQNDPSSSLHLDEITYAPPSDKEPELIFTVTDLPPESLGQVQFGDETAAEVGGTFSLQQLRGAKFTPAVNGHGDGVFSYTVAGLNPILNAPDPAELTENITIEVIGIDTNNAGDAFVAQVYRDLLHRNPTQEELDAVPDDMSDAADRSAFVMSLQNSRAYQEGEIEELYVTLLERPAEAEELAAWFTPDFALQEDFSGGELPFSLEIVGDGTTSFDDGKVTLSDQRHFLRTVTSDYLMHDFTAEVTTTISGETIDNPGDKIAFFGLGSGDPDADFFDEPRTPPFVLARIAPDDFQLGDSGSADLADNDTTDLQTTSEVGGTGTHRLRMTWDAETQTATFAVDQDYTGGPFTADRTFDPLDGSDNGFDATNSRLFFGGFGNVAFDDFTISGEDVVANLDQVQAELAGSDEYFLTRGGGSFEGVVDALYQDLLGRAPTEDEHSTQVDALFEGTDPAELARQIATSQGGSVRTVDGLYKDLLRQPAGVFDLVDSARQFQAEGTASVVNSLLSSDGYFTRYGTSPESLPFNQEELTAELILQWLNSSATIGNTVETDGFESVGVLSDRDVGRGGGTLIAPEYVLTAAHLVANRDVADLRFTIGGTTYGVNGVAVHPDYSPGLLGTDDANDIAILRLNREVPNVAPSPIYRGSLTVGEELTLVGFGPRAGDENQFGTKRVGTTPVDNISPTLLTWTYDGDQEATTVRGDSGSGQFVERDGVYYLAGIASGGTLSDSFIGDFAYNTRADVYVAWLTTVLGGEGLHE